MSGIIFGAIELAIVSSGVTWLASSSAAVTIFGVAIELAIELAIVSSGGDRGFGGGDHRGDRGKKSECASWIHSQ